MAMRDTGAKAMGEAACGVCGGRTYVLERRGDHAQAKVCVCLENCSVCEGRGHVLMVREGVFSQKMGPRRYEVMEPCACTQMRRKVSRFNEVELPGVVMHAGFDNFRPSNGAQDRCRSVAMNFAYQYVKGGLDAKGGPAKGFILSGPVGTGKTHLLAATLNHLVLELGIRARYVEISLLYATIRRGFQDGKSGGEIIGPLSDVEVLAIDELGKGRGSPFEMETLDELIARRYNAGRITLFATNFSLEPEKKVVRTQAPTGYRTTDDSRNAVREAELLRERVGERIYSRLCEMCTFLEVPRDTPDNRRTRQEMDSPLHHAPAGVRGVGR